MSTIAILGTMDTKGVEHAFVADLIRQRGHQVLVVDVGTLQEPLLAPDISRAEVAAALRGIPAVVSTGCLDMVNFGSPQSVPAKFAGRNFYHHNPQVTLMRTTPEECTSLGRILADKLNLSKGPVSVILPLKGGSVISAPGGPFHDAVADTALYNSLKAGLRPGIPVMEMDCDVNDPVFAEAAAKELLKLLGKTVG